jgi:hypothetical protein
MRARPRPIPAPDASSWLTRPTTAAGSAGKHGWRAAAPPGGGSGGVAGGSRGAPSHRPCARLPRIPARRSLARQPPAAVTLGGARPVQVPWPRDLFAPAIGATLEPLAPYRLDHHVPMPADGRAARHPPGRSAASRVPGLRTRLRPADWPGAAGVRGVPRAQPGEGLEADSPCRRHPSVRTPVLVPRDDLPLQPVPEWREVYGHLRDARDHLKAAEEPLRRKRRPTPRITATWQWLDALMRALRAMP